MEIGMIGLGRMGYHLSLNLLRRGLQVTAYDRNEQAVRQISSEGAAGVFSIEALVHRLQVPRTIWVMVPAGQPTEEIVERLALLLDSGDCVIDGGNSHYKESIRRAERLKEHGVAFLDAGTSGGMEGALKGACAMVGGDPEKFAAVEPLFRAICVKDGYLYAGPSGSGHFLKMIHNGIEYGMMQSIAEGFEILNKSEFAFDNEQVARVWNHGSVIRSWLMELTEDIFRSDPKLDGVKGVIHSSGEGKWTLETALELQLATPVIAMSLLMRYRSLDDNALSGKLVSALRREFGGHAVVQQ